MIRTYLRPIRAAQRGLALRRYLATQHHSTSSERPDIYDVVCIGGGPAGLALVNALRSIPETSRLKVALIEGQKILDTQSQTTDFSNRCSSLTPTSIRFLKNAAAWEHVDRSRVQPYHAMKVWDGVSGSSIDFDPADAMGPFTGVIPTQRAKYGDMTDGIASMIENSNLTAALAKSLKQDPQLEVFDATKVRDISLGEDTPSQADLRLWPVVALEKNDKKLAARLLVGADGFNSPVRAFSEINSRGWDYERHGVVATLRLQPGIADGVRTAFQRFLPSGPIALLPLPGDFASLVWSTTPDKASRLKSLNSPDFVALVNAAFRLLPVDIDYMHTMTTGHVDEVAWRIRSTMIDPKNLLPEAIDVQEGSIASFPLRMRHADTYIGERVALIGDAAHTIHPLAGQGLNQGLGDAKALAEQIRYSVSVGRDIGSSFALEEYNAAQWPKNNAMLGTVDKLHKLYSAASGPVVWARSLGLDAVDKMSWIKGFLMKQASGVR